MDREKATEELRESYFRIKKLSILIEEFLEEGDPDLLLDENSEEGKKREAERRELIKCLRMTIKKAQDEFVNLEIETDLTPPVAKVISEVKQILSGLLESLSNYSKALKDLH